MWLGAGSGFGFLFLLLPSDFIPALRNDVMAMHRSPPRGDFVGRMGEPSRGNSVGKYVMNGS